MATTIEVVFAGLALFCMNHQGALCEGGEDVVYLVNGTHDATVCGRDLDGGHEPRISFDARHLLPGSHHPHRLVKTGPTREHVTASLAGVDLCICVSNESDECPEPGANDPGAEPHWENVRPDQEDPQFFQDDQESFAWLPNLEELADVTTLCPLVNLYPLSSNTLVAARVWLDQGIVLTDPDWHDQWGWWLPRLFRHLTENDYRKWRFAPPDRSPEDNDMTRALPGHVMWRISETSPNATPRAKEPTILLNDCSDRSQQRTLFRLRPTPKPVRIYITNGPATKFPRAEGAPLNHFQWYYRLVDWDMGGCNESMPNSNLCPADLPLPHAPPVGGGDLAGSSKTLEAILTVGDKCPPVNGG